MAREFVTPTHIREEKIMRKRICVSLMALSFLVSMASASPAAYAKSIDGMRAQIPFDFHVGDSAVSAGEYTVQSLTADESALRISNGRESAAVMTNSTSKMGDGGHARLVFRRYGDQYFLAAVWGADNNGRSLSESKRERSLRKELRAARGYTAEAEIVTIDAR
jgi:hypothetical protein